MLGNICDAVSAIAKALQQSDPETLREILISIDSTPFEFLQTRHRFIGEMLASLDEHMSILNLRELGFAMIAEADLTKCWNETHDAVCDEIGIEELGFSQEHDQHPQKRQKK